MSRNAGRTGVRSIVSACPAKQVLCGGHRERIFGVLRRPGRDRQFGGMLDEHGGCVLTGTTLPDITKLCGVGFAAPSPLESHGLGYTGQLLFFRFTVGEVTH